MNYRCSFYMEISKANSKKTQSGIKNKLKVKRILLSLKEKGVILDLHEKVNFSYKGYDYRNQFLIDYVVKTYDEKYIIIRTSHSFRQDRAKIAFYDFLGAQLFSEFSGDIVASIFLFPDSVLDSKNFINNRNKFLKKEFYSPATHWLTISEFIDYLENYEEETKVEILNSLSDENLELDSHNRKGNKGSYYGRSGFKFERYIAEILNDPVNLKKYKTGNRECNEYALILDKVLIDYNVDKKDLININATDTVLKLNNLGSPKTDVHAVFYTTVRKNIVVNINIKNTTVKSVSCHDYRAKDFCRVVAPNDLDFCKAVNIFQRAGSWGNFKELVRDDEKYKKYINVIKSYMPKIARWAISGAGDIENLGCKEKQVANYLLTRNPKTNNCSFITVEEYLKKLDDMPKNRPGAPFQWTYPSGQRQKRIQLKMPVL